MSRDNTMVLFSCLIGLGLAIGAICLYRMIYIVSTGEERTTFTVSSGETVSELAERLEQEGVIESSLAFRLYTRLKKVDRQIRAGSYVVTGPVTLTKVVGELLYSGRAAERTITIIPGWDLYDIADYLVREQFIESREVFFDTVVGMPAYHYGLKTELPAPLMEIDLWQMTSPELQSGLTTTLKFSVLRDKPWSVSLEGYLAPETYRVYADATVEDVVRRLLQQRDKQFAPEIYEKIAASGYSVHEVLTLASIVEREVRSQEDRRRIADIFLRRLQQGWALQADSTVHYVVGKKGDVFTTARDREVDSLWNTYKYPGLPPGPISNPSMISVEAVVSPEKNDYWYFLTDLEGNVHYARTLDEHNTNVVRYLR